MPLAGASQAVSAETLRSLPAKAGEEEAKSEANQRYYGRHKDVILDNAAEKKKEARRPLGVLVTDDADVREQLPGWPGR